NDADDRQVVVTGTQAFRQDVPIAKAGMNVGLLLRGVKREEVQRGQVLTVPGVVKPCRKAKARIFVLSKEEGGRHTPFGSGYQPQFFFGTTDVTGVISVENDSGLVNPGDQVDIRFELHKPIGIEKGVRFAMSRHKTCFRCPEPLFAPASEVFFLLLIIFGHPLIVSEPDFDPYQINPPYAMI
ncbi:MAG: hypothetical protein P8163_19715, partial [Candidatus Thiodiazotropha sp.]